MSNGSNNLPATSDVSKSASISDEPPVIPIPRSASYTQLSPKEDIQPVPHKPDNIRRSLSENVLSHNNGRPQQYTGDMAEQTTKPRGPLLRRNSSKRQSTKVTVSQFIVGSGDVTDDATYKSQIVREAQPPARPSERQRIRRSISGSISKIARRSWISASRSPSPSPSKTASRRGGAFGVEPLTEPLWPLNAHEPKLLSGHLSELENRTIIDTNRKDSLLARKSRRPLSALLNKDVGNQTPSVPAVPRSFSTETLPLSKNKRSIVASPAIPRTPSTERFRTLGTDTPRKKDELWSAFRNLDGEFPKFQSRPSTTKTAIVRATLLPFLKTYSDHPSTMNLRPEDLDRRTVILNKWWTGLLEMLNGRNGESVSGNDRPAVLEAVTALMVRPEWTTPPSRPSKTTKASLKSSRSTTSLGSNMSDFLVDSVFHNVKNTFTQNLLAQMAYVVDKMSTRSIAASVVTFCGKATAYAFFYCEGVAEILVRLWNIPMETLRRITTEQTVKKSADMEDDSESLFAAFPTCLHSLSFRGLRLMSKYLRSRPHLPIATAYIPWQGPWIGRWTGRDTDLFFVFVKFYIELACRLLPENASPELRMAAPGWALVQAQLLTVLDATLHRSNNQPYTDQVRVTGPSTFDEMLSEANATATMLPLPVNGMQRSMAENRLVMLLRDCLSSSNIMGYSIQRVFAESFHSLLKAAAKGTSIFDHNACFTLCDFLEEALSILNRYHQSSGHREGETDWSFWLDVYRRILESHNSMTEIRLFAFIFSMWGPLTNDTQGKRDLCVKWLLSPETFQRQFNHWCPMVRAFYMRLLIWRVSRLESRNSELNTEILDTLYRRLMETWSYYLYTQEHAEMVGLPSPSTAPCSPAPSRCLLIVRDDVQPAPSGMFLSFDGILSSSATNKANPYEKHSSRDLLSEECSPPSHGASGHARQPPPSGKRRWALFKSIMPFTPPSEAIATTSSEPSLITQPKDTINSGANDWPLPSPNAGERSTKSDMNGIPAGSSTISHQALSFKFSLEWMDKDDRSAWKNKRLYPPQIPLPALLSRQQQPSIPSDLVPRKPAGAAVGPSKYAGRALAEWNVLVAECQIFFERRKAEGVPSYQLVETPMLSVDPFRKT